jgi:hypothetical protein
MRSIKNNDAIGIQFNLDTKINDLLTQSAHKNGRSKKSEAYMRLADHLLRYSDLVSIGRSICSEDNTINHI